MTRTQIQFPDPLYKELKAAAKKMDTSLADVIRRAAEAYLPSIQHIDKTIDEEWVFPTLPPREMTENASEIINSRMEAEAIEERYLETK